MKRVLNSMWGFWLVLLVISLGSAAVVYEVWLRDRM